MLYCAYVRTHIVSTEVHHDDDIVQDIAVHILSYHAILLFVLRWYGMGSTTTGYHVAAACILSMPAHDTHANQRPAPVKEVLGRQIAGLHPIPVSPIPLSRTEATLYYIIVLLQHTAPTLTCMHAPTEHAEPT